MLAAGCRCEFAGTSVGWWRSQARLARSTRNPTYHWIAATPAAALGAPGSPPVLEALPRPAPVRVLRVECPRGAVGPVPWPSRLPMRDRERPGPEQLGKPGPVGRPGQALKRAQAQRRQSYAERNPNSGPAGRLSWRPAAPGSGRARWRSGPPVFRLPRAGDGSARAPS